jgi:uncharacterized membrane protein
MGAVRGTVQCNNRDGENGAMIWLILGLLLWSGAHFLKRLAPGIRRPMGDRGKGVVALLSVAAIVLMVIGYRSWDSAILWNRASWAIHLNNLAMLVALYLYAASGMKTRVTRLIRHPQLTAVLIWAGAHIIANGDVASLVLFGGLGLWAAASIALINAQDAPPMPNPPAPIGKEFGAMLGAVLVTGAIAYVHVWFGLSPFR